MSTPGVRLILSSSGGSFLGAVNQASVYVRIAPHEERVFSLTKLWNSIKEGHPLAAWRGNYTQRDVMQEVRQRLQKYAPIRCSVRNAPSFNIGGGQQDIDFVFRGPELNALAKYAESLRQQTKQIGGIVDTSNISTALRLMVGGDDQVSRFRDASVNEDYDVQLRLSERDRKDVATIARLYVPSSRAGLVRVDNLVDIKEELSPSRIDRLDRQRMAAMRAGVAPGFALADRLDALRKAAAAMNLPATYSTTVAGRGRELERTFVEFLWAFLLSIIFMYMILASQFESTIHPLTILLSLPLSVPFALLSLWLLGDTLNLYSALGILVLFGVVKKNAILQIDHMNGLRTMGMDRGDAILQANRDRLRPILMTTLALVAGMTPLALGTGPGAEERRSIAIVVIGGQSLSLLLTLIATPVVYSLLDDLRSTARWRRFAINAGRFTAPVTRVVRRLAPTRDRHESPLKTDE